MSGKPIQVLIIDDHQLIIDGLKSVLFGEDDVAFAGGANNLEEALDFLKNHNIDLILADINLPGSSGIEATKLIRDLYPDIKILALTMHEDISIIAQMVEAGASGYILKRTNMNEVLDAIRAVAAGGKYLGQDVQSIMMENLSAKNYMTATEPDSSFESLTNREKEVLGLIAREMTNEEIGEKLFISERTVETHRRNIFTKTKAKSIVGLIKYAMAHGLIAPEETER